jgi:hypothetical protein
MRNQHTHKFVILSCVVIAAACDHGSRPASTKDSVADNGVQQIALTAISEVRRERLDQLDRKNLQIHAETSSAVPQLVYYRAVYEPLGSSHMESVVVVAQRDNVRRILATVEDFRSLVGPWFPDSSAAAITACGELATTIGSGARQKEPSELYSRSDYWRAMGFAPPGPPWRQRVTAPRAKVSSDGWAVNVWIAEAGRLANYTCDFGHSGIRLSDIDSVPNAGRLPASP